MTSWWSKTSRYLSSHSNLFIVTGGLVGGAYLVGQYAISRFQQIQEKLVTDKNAKENLRRRFAQNQEDCTFTVLALLPTLGDQLFSKHNVEQLTDSLRSQAAPAAAPPPPPLPQAQPVTAVQAEQPPSSSSIQIVAEAATHPPPPVTEPIASSPHSAPQQQPLPQQSNTAEPPTPQLNPLAKSFVPGTVASPTGSETSSAPQPHVVNDLTANGTSSSRSADPLAQKPDPAFSTAAPVAQDDATDQNDDIVKKSSSSHLDAQEQRNKILADRQEKLRLWNQLKLTAFTRTVTSLYCVVLLTLQTHIQLNLIGRFAYLASVEALARESDEASDSQSYALDPTRGLDHDTERLYLTFSWWFLHQGWDRLSDRVSSAIQQTFSPLSVKAQLSMPELRALIDDARYLIEHQAPPASSSTDPSAWKRSTFLDILFPNSLDDEIDTLVGAGAVDANGAHFALNTNHKLRALLDETRDIIESHDFGTILALCIERVFDTFFDSLNPTFGIEKIGKLDSTVQVQPLSALESRFQEITDEMQQGKRVRLASLFPLVSRQSQMAIRGVPNDYIEALADSKEVRAFSAVLYAAWSSL